MARRFTNVSMVKGFLVAGLLAFAGPALAAPGPGAHSQGKASKYDKSPTVVVVTPAAKKGKGSKYDKSPTVVVATPAPKGKAKQRDRVTVVAAPKVVVQGDPRVSVSYRPQVVVTAPRPVQERPSQALRLRLERAQASGRLSNRELRSLVTALQRVEAAERRFFRDDRRLDRSELRTLARLEASFDASLQQAMRRQGRA
ncbi:MAG: hypothetical protein R3F39_00645 [Myxococcota bacterium]